MAKETSLPFQVLMLQLGSIIHLKPIKELVNHFGTLVPLGLTNGLGDSLRSDLENSTSPSARNLRRRASLSRSILNAQILEPRKDKTGDRPSILNRVTRKS
jgi:hypothetical protein